MTCLGIADDRIPPRCPVCCIVLFQTHPVMSLLQASFHIWFGRPLLLFPGMSTSSMLLTMWSTFIIFTWPYHSHFSRFSVIFLDACTTLVVPLICVHFISDPSLSLHTSISASSSHLLLVVLLIPPLLPGSLHHTTELV